MTLHTREGSSQRTTAATSALTTTNPWHSDTAAPSSETDPRAQLRALLSANTRNLTGTTGLARRTLLLDRAQIWEGLADTPPATWTSAQTYRNVASVCRQEADTLIGVP